MSDLTFEHGQDIGQSDVLAALAASVGLEGDQLERSLEWHEYLSGVLASEEKAASCGLSGVPAFMAGGEVLFGVQPAKWMTPN